MSRDEDKSDYERYSRSSSPLFLREQMKVNGVFVCVNFPRDSRVFAVHLLSVSLIVPILFSGGIPDQGRTRCRFEESAQIRLSKTSKVAQLQVPQIALNIPYSSEI